MRQQKQALGVVDLKVLGRHTIDKSVTYWLGVDIDEMQHVSKSSLQEWQALDMRAWFSFALGTS